MLTNKGWNDIIGTTYDAYGNHKILLDTNGIGTLNPIRYRGYYYDVETGLYYDGMRYYDPDLARYLSPAGLTAMKPDKINGLNQYSYSNNNPNRPKKDNKIRGSRLKNYEDLSLPDIPITTSSDVDFYFVPPTFSVMMLSMNDVINELYSFTAGSINDYRYLTNLDEIKPLKKASKALFLVNIGVGLIEAGYNNFNNESLSLKEKYIGFAVDAALDVGVPTLIGLGVSYAVTTIAKALIGSLFLASGPVAVAAIAVSFIITMCLTAAYESIVEKYGLREKAKDALGSA